MQLLAMQFRVQQQAQLWTVVQRGTRSHQNPCR